jgi:Zn-dependent peptidase ImmA (M78 family)/transcriptional regulator with XRE-family HTH domain
VTVSQAGERIRAARLLLGLTQGELATTAGVSQPLISNVEKGTREATDDLVRAIASSTRTPQSFFQFDDGDGPVGTLRFRKLARTSQTEATRVDRTVREAYRVASGLLADMNGRPQLPRATGDVTSERIEDLAKQVRSALGLDDTGPIRHLTRACERAGIGVAPLVLASMPDEDETKVIGHTGASCWRGPEEPVLIGYFNAGPGDRQRFTLGHELGHAILHAARPELPGAEQEANRFAGALLFPEERAKEALTDTVTLRDLAMLKARWGISIQALIMRGSHLGLISDDRKLSLFKQISARGWRKQEPVTVHPEEPILLWTLLARRYGEPVQYPQISEEVGLQAVILRSLAPAPKGKAEEQEAGTVRPIR